MKKNKIIVLGKGFIGKRISEYLGCTVIHTRIDTYKDIEKLIKKYQPTVIINAIGHVGLKNVDDCERNIDKTIHSNTFIPLLLAETAYRYGIKLVHISSGCIYNFDYTSQQPLTEDSQPDYYTLYYSRTKIYTENALSELSKYCNVLILRIRIPLDDRPDPRNILTKLLTFDKVIDNANSVTYIPDFLKALKHLMRIDAKGVFNVVLKGGLRYPELLDMVQQYNKGFTYQIMQLNKLKLNRTNILLSVKKLENTGLSVRTPQQIYKECVRNYVKSL